MLNIVGMGSKVPQTVVLIPLFQFPFILVVPSVPIPPLSALQKGCAPVKVKVVTTS
jgi:hypothetical protein